MSWNEPGGDKDPWSGRGNNKKPPDLDEAIRSLQEKLSKFFSGGDSGGGGSSNNTSSGNPMKGIGFLLGGALILWGLTGTYIVNEGNYGVETRFGKYTTTTDAGLHWHLPVPIERVEIVNVKQQRFIEVGYRSMVGSEQAANSVPKEALMLTKDENIIDVRLAVQYQVSNAEEFLFSVANPIATLKQVTESVERGVVGSNDMDFILTAGRSQVAALIKKEIQDVMDSYHAGILIIGVNLQDAQPPKDVQDAFMDAVKANGDKERFINEAQAYYNDIVPKARGAAARQTQEAEGYQKRVIAEATGEASRFSRLVAEYRKAPSIMRERIYIETIESVLANSNTVMLNTKEGANNMLYLPLDKLLSTNNDSSSVASEPTTPSATVESHTSTSVSKSTVAEIPAYNRKPARGRDIRGRSDVE